MNSAGISAASLLTRLSAGMQPRLHQLEVEDAVPRDHDLAVQGGVWRKQVAERPQLREVAEQRALLPRPERELAAVVLEHAAEPVPLRLVLPAVAFRQLGDELRLHRREGDVFTRHEVESYSRGRFRRHLERRALRRGAAADGGRAETDRGDERRDGRRAGAHAVRRPRRRAALSRAVRRARRHPRTGRRERVGRSSDVVRQGVRAVSTEEGHRDGGAREPAGQAHRRGVRDGAERGPDARLDDLDDRRSRDQGSAARPPAGDGEAGRPNAASGWRRTARRRRRSAGASGSFRR